MVAMKNNSRRRAAQQGVVRWRKYRGYAHKCGHLSYENLDVFMGVTVQANNSIVDHQHDWLTFIETCSKDRVYNAAFHYARTTVHIVPSSTVEAFNEKSLKCHKRHLDQAITFMTELQSKPHQERG